MAFLQLWWDETATPQQQADFTTLVHDGRIEFVDNGWWVVVARCHAPFSSSTTTHMRARTHLDVCATASRVNCGRVDRAARAVRGRVGVGCVLRLLAHATPTTPTTPTRTHARTHLRTVYARDAGCGPTGVSTTWGAPRPTR